MSANDSPNNAFVFVVCGKREHIDTLHFSLEALQRFSKNEILIVTDATRNEIAVVHDRVIDIQTPQDFNHHQASIYLKTGLHKFLPVGNTYCYLDTDVVALNEKVDEIFSQYISPITFCTDHCKIDAFSPSAVNCGCFQKYEQDTKRISKFYETFNTPEYLYAKQCVAEINALVKQSKRSEFIYFFHRVRYLLPGRFYHINKRYRLEKETGAWFDDKGTQLTHSLKSIKDFEKETNFEFDSSTSKWSRSDGTSLSNLTCPHLIEAIKAKFNVAITDGHWNHWNGGVFLFDDSSRDFLDTWHNSTLGIFKDPDWKTRDQGTLAMTVWKFNLQRHKTLPLHFNFIADYYSDSAYYKGDFTFHMPAKDLDIHPAFIHIYHHWGDETWAVWRDVKNHFGKN